MRAVFEKTIANYITGNNLRFRNFRRQDAFKKQIYRSPLCADVPVYEGIKLMPTYHPAYLLRNPSAKKQVWEDVQMIMKEVKL